MIKVIWTDSALNDLRSIRDYIARDSVFYAEKFVEDVLSQTKKLEVFPKVGRIVPEKNSRSIREIIFGSYRIIYKVTDKVAYIVTIVHGKRMLEI